MSGCRYTWTVEDFSQLSKEEDFYIRSPVFYGGARDGLQADWTLVLYPRSRKGIPGIALFLHNTSCNYASLEVWANVWLSNQAHQKHFEQTQKLAIRAGETTGYGWDGMAKFHKLKANNLLEDDKLRVNCELHSMKATGLPLGAVTPRGSMDRFSSMYERKQLTDMTIAVGTQQFHVHKFMLAANSPVFSAMFDHQMEETQLSRIEIQDFDKETVKTFIKYIYTGECQYSQLEENSNQMLAFSEKYDIKDLKMKCEAVVARTLNVGNAAELLQFADVQQAEGLKKIVMNFIKDNLQRVLSTAGWKTLPRPLVDDFLKTLAATLSKTT